MEKERPVAVRTFAILNIVLGSLGAVFLYCVLAILEPGFGLVTSSEWVLPNGSRMRVPPFPSDALAVSIAGLVIQFILFIALIFAGIGLLGINAWARKLCIVLSIMGILWALIDPAINTIYMKPRVEKYEKDLLQAVRDHLKNQQLQSPYPRPRSPAIKAIGSLFIPVMISTYSVVMLGFMLRPQVAAAFSGKGIHQSAWGDFEPEEVIKE